MSYVSQHNGFVYEGSIGMKFRTAAALFLGKGPFIATGYGGWEVQRSITHVQTVRDQCGPQRTVTVVCISTASSDIQRTLGFWDVISAGYSRQ
jgi:hypothetical protein